MFHMDHIDSRAVDLAVSLLEFCVELEYTWRQPRPPNDLPEVDLLSVRRSMVRLLRASRPRLMKLQDICLEKIADALHTPKERMAYDLPIPTCQKRRLRRWIKEDYYVF